MNKLKRIPVQEFLADRQAWREMVAKHKGPHDVICDPGNEIICDYCNADALTEDGYVLIINDMCACTECAKGKSC